jgi:hypothetical protein
VATNYFDVKKSGAKYIEDEQMSNDFVYIIPQYGNQLNGNTVCEYGRQSGATYAKFDISDLDYLENYDFEIGRVDISSPDNEIADYIPPTRNIYYQFTTKEHKIIENYNIKDPNNTDYKIVVITVVDKANSSAPAVCNVCRAIKVKISDFFTLEKPSVDYVISNPPYSRRQEVLTKLYEWDIPFAMIFNANGLLDSKTRMELARGGMEILYIYPRVSFIGQNGERNHPAFQSVYWCHNVLPEKLVFEWLDGQERLF